MNSLKVMSLIVLLGLSTTVVQAMEIEHPFEATEERVSHQTMHPFAATDARINTCTYCPEKLYRKPLHISFFVNGNVLEGEKVRITCSDRRSVLLPDTGDVFYTKTYAVMPGYNRETLEEQKHVNYNKLPDCYNAFKAPVSSKNNNLKLVETYDFGNAKNLNGVSIKAEETQNPSVWNYSNSAWLADFVFFPWAPGILSDANLTKDWKNPSELYFEVTGNIAGIPCAKYSAIIPYLGDIDQLSPEPHKMIEIDGKFIKAGIEHHNKKIESFIPKNKKKKISEPITNNNNND